MDGTIISSTTSAPRPSTLRHPSPNLSSSSRSSSSSSAMSEQYSSAASNGSMAAHIVPFPSLAHSLSSLQYATSMQNVPIHHQAKGRSAESEEKLKRAIASASSQGIPSCQPQCASNTTQVPTSDNYLMMRSGRR